MIQEPDLESLHKAYTKLQTEPGLEAINDLEKLAERGSLMSMVYLGGAYEDGIAVLKNESQAENWYRRAMDGGSNLAVYYLGHLYLDKQDYLKAKEIFSYGDLKGYSPTTYRLAYMYLDGKGIPKDERKAFELFKKASDDGHVFAKRKLAGIYLSGKYGVTNIFKGFFLFLIAVKDVIALSIIDPHSDHIR